ncbi:chaperone modulator CbpM [Thermodesulforhabdus norvegica]|uniref:DNA-binding transcriptional regulator, MerR family n=1 Tax=Thermodesulforhabdus norvegica TaxID=39841 RepID=A0A1I4RKN7_9BACT|nr:chaperone modulator CbpM [Thermodesulforhabdus norvegica]SFM52838.1 DNA-binding transcriptional regulator, MerR family [Thermodesulforhabdus norvegica]
MATTRYCLVRYEEAGQYLRIEQVAEACGVHPELIDRFVRLGLIDPVDNESELLLFELDTVPLVRKIIRLRNDLGINYAGVGVVIDLLDRLDSLERRIEILEEQIAKLIALAST